MDVERGMEVKIGIEREMKRESMFGEIGRCGEVREFEGVGLSRG